MAINPVINTWLALGQNVSKIAMRLWGTQVETDIAALETAVAGKANTTHGHVIGDVTGLQTALDSKEASGAAAAAIAAHNAAADPHPQYTTAAELLAAIAGKSNVGHGHAIADVTGLQTALDGKAASVHGHAIADVTGLQTALDGKAASVHGHAIADVTGLQTALDAKAAAATVRTQGRESIFIPAHAWAPRTTNGAGFATLQLSNGNMIRPYDFDAITEEFIGFGVFLPKSWNEGVIRFQFEWTAASGSGGVVFEMSARAFSDGDSLDVATGGAVSVTDTFIGANVCHVSPESADLTIAGSPADGDRIYLQVSRKVADAADTLAVDARLLGVRVFFTTNAGNDA